MQTITTLSITRTKALSYILDHIGFKRMWEKFPFTETQLKEWLDVLLKERFYNVTLVPDTEQNNHDGYLL